MPSTLVLRLRFARALLLTGTAQRNRLLSPDLVAFLVRIAEDPQPFDLALDLRRVDHASAHDTGTAGSSMRLGNAISEGQSILGQPDANLSPKLVLADTHKEPPRQLTCSGLLRVVSILRALEIQSLRQERINGCSIGARPRSIAGDGSDPSAFWGLAPSRERTNPGEAQLSRTPSMVIRCISRRCPA
jgi:hypothetical protein